MDKEDFWKGQGTDQHLAVDVQNGGGIEDREVTLTFTAVSKQ